MATPPFQSSAFPRQGRTRVTPRSIERSILAVVMAITCLGPGRGFGADGDVGAGCEWYRQDSLARELSQLTEREIAKFAESELIAFQPVVVS